MSGRDDSGYDWRLDLGKPLGESTIVQNRKARTVVHEFERGWTIVAARVGGEDRHKFRAMVNRCPIDHDHKRCFGSAGGVRQLTQKIRSTYQ